jgi:2-amino-4-hydroxy-6-hydroxymethyldihydropteridine diphosphokinase
MSIAWIGLGSNLDQPAQQLTTAFEELAQLPRTQLRQTSRLWHSKPMGPQDQPDYINAVAQLDTELEPLQLLDALQQLEQQHQRIKLRHWGERTLDLDLLLYDQLEYQHPRLTLPHPGITQRGFVLLPLAELAAELLIPGKGSVRQLLQGLTPDALQGVLPLEANSLSGL